MTSATLFKTKSSPKKSLKLFITGTDTHVGKTYVSIGLLKAFNRLNYTTLGLKPIATGCTIDQQPIYNADTLALLSASSIKLHIRQVTPFAFQPAIAPHIAAAKKQCTLNVKELSKKLRYGLMYPANICIIEGTGGWYVPLNHTETIADFVLQHQFPVILVVGMRLGCLNHALLTQKALETSGIHVVGWIANCIDPDMEYLQENIMTLKTILHTPCLGMIAYQSHPEDQLEVKKIISLTLQYPLTEFQN